MSKIICKMKFVVEKIGSATAGRSGLLDFVEGSSTVTYKTPMYFAHTTGGSIPHITNEVFNMVFKPDVVDNPGPPLQVSLECVIKAAQSMIAAGKGMDISEFVGYKGSPCLMTTLNPVNGFHSGYNDKNGISLWSRKGRMKIDFEIHRKVMEALEPSVYQVLSDYDVSSMTLDKRLKKATTRAMDYFEKTLDALRKSGENGGEKLLFTVEPAWFSVNAVEAEKTLAQVLENRDKIAGFMIRRDSSSEEGFVKNVFEILPKLPSESVRYVSGVLELNEIIDLVISGVDLFDSSLCTDLSEEKEVILLPDLFVESLGGASVPKEDLPVREKDGASDPISSLNGEDRSKLVILDLKDKKYFGDFQPLDSTCNCYTCRKHTRSYVHHLHATNELLGYVLIMIHNLHTFDQFFRVIRKYQQEGKSLEDVKECLTEPLKLRVSGEA